MENIYKLLVLTGFLFGISFQASTQITIDSQNLLILNTKIVNAYDTTNPNLNLGTTGSGQNWDFSNVTESETDIDSVRKPAGTFGEDHFANAGIAIDDGDSGFVYLNKSTTELVIVGFSELEINGDTANQDLNMKIVTFPSSMGTKFTDEADNFSFAFDFNIDPDGPGPHPFIDSLGVISSTSASSEMDAEGSLKTKVGNYNALRQHFITTHIDSTFMYTNGSWKLISPLMVTNSGNDSVSYDTSHTYRFWAENTNFPVVEIEYDMVNGIVEEFQWLKEIVVGNAELKHETVEVITYPNPANHYLNIESDLNLIVIEINDIQGRRIEKKIIHGNSKLNMSHIEDGTYLLNVYSDSGNLLQSKMIQVQH